MCNPRLMFLPGLVVWLGKATGMVWLALVCGFSEPSGAAGQDAPGPTTLLAACLRRPIALQVDDEGRRLLAANQRSGSLSVIDLDAGCVTHEMPLGQRLSDLKPLAPGSWLATDESAHQLILLRSNDASASGLVVQQRLEVAKYPVTIQVLPQGRGVSVASLWSRRLTWVAWDGEQLRVAGALDLPFAPRLQCMTKDGSELIVADSFANRLAVVAVDPLPEARLKHVRTFPCHNIRGLTVSQDGQRLLVAHQMLNELAHTVQNDVHWGLLMSNDLRWLPLKAVLEADGDLYRGSNMIPLGQPGNGAGDPSGLAVTPSGQVLVSLGGNGELAVAGPQRFNVRRLTVGRRPTAIAVSATGDRAWVANTFDDSVSEIDLQTMEVRRTISLGPQAELSLADRGELLFYDATLSHDGWFSCHSCHTDGHSNGMLNDNFSDATFGAPKRVLSLLGRAGTEPFAWAGNAMDLQTQIRKSISKTLQSDHEPKDKHVAALQAFILQLPPPPAVDAARGRVPQAAVERGRAVFHQQQCVQCHAPPRYTTPAIYDVGLADERSQTEFNPPTLLGVSQRESLFHDGRALDLSQVLGAFQHQLTNALDPQEKDDLLAFLRSL